MAKMAEKTEGREGGRERARETTSGGQQRHEQPFRMMEHIILPR